MQAEEKVNWVSVINFLEKEYTQISIREKYWLFEKKALSDQICILEAYLRASRTICDKLLARVKLLEVAMLQMKLTHKPVSTLNDNALYMNKIASKYSLYRVLAEEGHREFIETIIAGLGIKDSALDLPPIVEDKTHFEYDKGVVKIIDKEKFMMRQKCRMALHLDAVTQLYSSLEEKFIASVSEDCLIKLWSKESLLVDDQAEPVRTLRYHTGPLFSMSGGRNTNSYQYYYLFTSGSYGCIKLWTIPDYPSISKIKLSSSWMNDSTSNDDHTIWELAYRNNRLLSSSSDGVIRLFAIGRRDEQEKLEELEGTYKDKLFMQNAVTWISEQTFASGCQNAPRITLWDLNGKICQKYLYEVDKNRDAFQFQVNRLAWFSTLKTIAAGCEDNYIRLFDYNQGKLIKKLSMTASVGALSLRNNYQIVAGCQDSSFSIWDIRNCKYLLHEANCHSTKYNSGILCILANKKYIITGGADGIINIYV